MEDFLVLQLNVLTTVQASTYNDGQDCTNSLCMVFLHHHRQKALMSNNAMYKVTADLAKLYQCCIMKYDNTVKQKSHASGWMKWKLHERSLAAFSYSATHTHTLHSWEVYFGSFHCISVCCTVSTRDGAFLSPGFFLYKKNSSYF